MKLKVALAVFALLACDSCVSFPSGSTGTIHYDVVWDRLIVNGTFQVPRALVHTSDGGYAVAGYTLASLVPDHVGALQAFWTIKFDPDGKVQWQRAFAAEIPKRDEDAYTLTETHDGGLLVVGDTESDSLAGMPLGATTDPRSVSRSKVGFAIKYDRAGTLLWKKALIMPKEQHPYDTFYAALTVSDGYVLAGTYARIITSPPDNRHVAWTLRLLKLNESGDTLWNRTYPDGESSITSLATEIVPTSDSGFVFAVAPVDSMTRRVPVIDDKGKVVGERLPQRAVILKFNHDGDLVKRAEFRAATDHLALGANADGYLLSGYYKYLWYAFFDHDLNLKWKKIVPEGGTVRALWAAPDDSFYGTGATNKTSLVHIGRQGEFLGQDTLSASYSGSGGGDIAPSEQPDDFVVLWRRIPGSRAGLIKVRVPVK